MLPAAPVNSTRAAVAATEAVVTCASCGAVTKNGMAYVEVGEQHRRWLESEAQLEEQGHKGHAGGHDADDDVVWLEAALPRMERVAAAA